jgi:tRNA pseudouridine13 synthase
LSLAPRPVPLLTPELPGTGGLTRVSEEDFRVEELPLYEPQGQGEHLYVTVEKQGRTTPEVAHELAQALSAKDRDVGTAGLKDKRAVTVQRMSVLTRSLVADAVKLTGNGWRVLAAARHNNKLRPGHLRGNRFRIVVRGVSADAPERARTVLARLAAVGVANLFGPQRFGKREDNAALGRAILLREVTVRDRFLKRMALSALQSELFNRCLTARIQDGLFSTAIEGDVLRKRDSGGLFVGGSVDAPRVAAAEIDPAGPLPGHSLYAARDAALDREQAVLRESEIEERWFIAGGDEMQGARRPYRIPLEDALLEELPEASLALTFALPKGSYAMAVLREVMKDSSAEDLE